MLSPKPKQAYYAISIVLNYDHHRRRSCPIPTTAASPTWALLKLVQSHQGLFPDLCICLCHIVESIISSINPNSSLHHYLTISLYCPRLHHYPPLTRSWMALIDIREPPITTRKLISPLQTIYSVESKRNWSTLNFKLTWMHLGSWLLTSKPTGNQSISNKIQIFLETGANIGYIKLNMICCAPINPTQPTITSWTQ